MGKKKTRQPTPEEQAVYDLYHLYISAWTVFWDAENAASDALSSYLSAKEKLRAAKEKYLAAMRDVFGED